MNLYTDLTIILPKAAQPLAQWPCVAAAGKAGARIGLQIIAE